MNNLRPLALGVFAGMACVFMLVGCDSDEESEAKELPVFTGKGTVNMRYIDLVEGKGEAAKKFDIVEVHYTGWTGGRKFDSSLDRNKPFQVALGFGKVIKGWDEAIPGMKAGGKRKLFIPPELGYGPQGHPPAIPPNAKLVFEVELLRIVPPDQYRGDD
jgi:FKBP-type peptidyl-prolyl cis-trans isomerase FkpA